jgi:hypothetical protein
MVCSVDGYGQEVAYFFIGYSDPFIGKDLASAWKTLQGIFPSSRIYVKSKIKVSCV